MLYVVAKFIVSNGKSNNTALNIRWYPNNRQMTNLKSISSDKYHNKAYTQSFYIGKAAQLVYKVDYTTTISLLIKAY